MYCLRGASQTHPEGWSSLLHVWIHPLLGGGFHHTLAVADFRAVIAGRAGAWFAKVFRVPDRHKGEEADREVEFDSGLTVFVFAIVDVLGDDDTVFLHEHPVIFWVFALRSADVDGVNPSGRRLQLKALVFTNAVLAFQLDGDVFIDEGERPLERGFCPGR